MAELSKVLVGKNIEAWVRDKLEEIKRQQSKILEFDAKILLDT